MKIILSPGLSLLLADSLRSATHDDRLERLPAHENRSATTPGNMVISAGRSRSSETC
jgi:hypothetical protein